MKSTASFLLAFALLSTGLAPGDEITVTPAVIKVGKWPEGLALVGESLWVAESGDRALAKYEAARGVLIERHEVGRLPVHLATRGDTLYATINTDKKIHEQTPQGPGRVLGSTGADAPESITTDANAVHVLLHLNGSSEDSAVMRLDLPAGGTTRSPSLGTNATDILVAGEHLWVVSAPVVNGQPDGTLARLDPDTLELIERIPVGGRLSRLAGAQGLLFVGGGEEEAGTLASIDSESGEMFGFAEYGGSMVTALAADDEFVISVDHGGTIHVHHQTTLIPQRTIRLDVDSFTPRDLLVTPGALYLSAQHGDVGIVYRINDWKPARVLTETPAATIFRTESLGTVSLGHSESEMEARLGAPEKWGAETENEIEGGFSIEASYPAKGIVVTLGSLEKGDTRTVEAIRVTGDAEPGTAAGIRLGATLEEVRKAYGAYEDTSLFPVPDARGTEFTFLAGSAGGGLFFEFKEGRVAAIYLGPAGE